MDGKACDGIFDQLVRSNRIALSASTESTSIASACRSATPNAISKEEGVFSCSPIASSSDFSVKLPVEHSRSESISLLRDTCFCFDGVLVCGRQDHQRGMGMLDTVLHLATRFVQRCAWLSKVEETDGVRSSGIENTGCAVSWIEYSNGNASCCSVSFPVHKAPVR